MIEPARFFKLLADETRLRILMQLWVSEELCVCELQHTLEVNQSTISRHLGLLRDTRVAIRRRNGSWMYYRINPDLPGWAKTVLGEAWSSVEEREPFRTDRQRASQDKDFPCRIPAAGS